MKKIVFILALLFAYLIPTHAQKLVQATQATTDTLSGVDTTIYIINIGGNGYETLQIEIDIDETGSGTLAGTYTILGSLTGNGYSANLGNGTITDGDTFIWFEDLQPSYILYKITLITSSSGTKAMPKLYSITKPYYFKH